MRFNTILQGGLLQASLALAQTFPISGISAGVSSNGARPARLDIATFANSGPAWDLYLLAMQNFTQMDQQTLTSYFQISGIHGYPNIPWDGVSGQQDGIGFCTHSSILFPSWHRPYMALFEQAVWNAAQSIAQTYPDSNRAQYVQAAQTLRIPYWDWSISAQLPGVASTPSIQVNTPSGQQTINNPLWTYQFGDASNDQSLFPSGTDGPQTARHPDSSGNTDNAATNAAMQQVASSLHSGTYHLFSQLKNYAGFANANYQGSSGGFTGISLEGFHNTVHGQVGGDGQMSDISLAAFDPIFWLHHANVDRLFAIWEAINPKAYTTPYASGSDSWVSVAGTTEDVNTPLLPFHKDTQGSVFSSADVRSTKAFGYTYPEVIDWNKTARQLTSDVTAAVNKLYNPSGSRNARRSRLATRAPALSDANNANYQWVIDVSADLSHLEQTIFIHFYLTTPPTSPAAWASDPNVAATQPILINSGMNMDKTHTTSGQSYLTYALIPLTENLSPDAVLPFLQKNLQWRATYKDGSVVVPEAINAAGAINVTVAGLTVEQTAPVDEFPIYGDWEIHGSAVLGSNGVSVL